MDFASQKTAARRLLAIALTIAALAFSGSTSNAQTPAAQPDAAPVETITPAQWLQLQPKPVFKPGHTMPALTRYGWDLSYETHKVLAEDWHYALQTNYLTDEVVARFDDPTTREAKMGALTLLDPEKYPLAVILDRSEPANPAPETFLRDAEGKLIAGNTYSPLNPQSTLDQMAELRARPLRGLRKKVPINIILNGGEYGLGVPGFMRDHAAKDPIVAAAQTKSGLDWVSFISRAKGREMDTIADAVRKAVSDRKLYIYYSTGPAERNRYWGWRDWGMDPEDALKASDLSSTEYYYKHFNTGYLNAGDNNDMLSRALNAGGFQIGHGKKYSYDWLSAGWVNEADGNGNALAVAAPAPAPAPEVVKKPRLQEGNAAALVDPTVSQVSPMDLYTGFLKCIFTAGTLGGNAGYYSVPIGHFDGSFPAEKPSHYLPQMTALSQVQALFSYLEDDVRNSDLLPGPNKHAKSTDQPAYEFPTGDKALRVLARKREGQEKWLVTAWAADGVNRPVTVTIPGLGEVTLLARAAGCVYTVTLKDKVPQLILNDADAMAPTSKGFKPRKVTTEQIMAPFAKAPKAPLMTNLQLWFDADKGVEKDKDDGVVSWTPQGTLANWQVASKPAGKPLWAKDAANGLPAVRFVGGGKGLFSQELDAAAGFGGSKKTIFAVYASNVPFGYGGDGTRVMQASIVGEGQPIIFVVGNAPNPEEKTWQIKMAVTDAVGKPNYLALGSTVSKEHGGEGPQMDDRNLNGDLAEVLVYNGTLTPIQQFQIQSYLRAKYKLGF